MLGGQHSVAALLRLWATRAQEGLSIAAPWLEVVRATRVIRYGADLEACQLFAGEHQAQQGGTQPLLLSNYVALLLQSPPDQPLLQRIFSTVQKTGWERPASKV